MQVLVPGFKVWLDVDDGKRSMQPKKTKQVAPKTLEETYQRLVSSADSVVIFLSGTFAANDTPVSTYFKSMYCRHECIAAVKYKKRIVIVLEIDPSHGGISLRSHMDEAKKHLDQTGMPEVVEMLERHAKQGWIVPWHRIRPYQDVSLKLLLAPIVCKDATEVDGQDTRRGQLVYLPSEVTRQPLPLLPPGCYVYVSPHNPGAAEVAGQLASKLEGMAQEQSSRSSKSLISFRRSKATAERHSLTWSEDEGKKEEAGRFLLLLNASTWDRKKNSKVDQLFE